MHDTKEWIFWAILHVSWHSSHVHQAPWGQMGPTVSETTPNLLIVAAVIYGHQKLISCIRWFLLVAKKILFKFSDLFKALSELIILTASRCLHGKVLLECIFRPSCCIYTCIIHALSNMYFVDMVYLYRYFPNEVRWQLIPLFARLTCRPNIKILILRCYSLHVHDVDNFQKYQKLHIP